MAFFGKNEISALILSMLAVSHAGPTSKYLPKGFIQCMKNDQQCEVKRANEAVPELARGVPKLGIPPIDPLRITNLLVDQGTGSVAIKLNFKDLDIIGIKNFRITQSKFNFEKGTLDLELYSTKPILLKSKYTIKGKVLILPIHGNGDCLLTLSGFKGKARANLKEMTKAGDKVHWQIDDLDFDFDASKVTMNFENLFNGDKALGDNMNVFLNENWEELLRDLKPAFRKALSTAFAEIAQRFFSRVPLEQIFVSP